MEDGTNPTPDVVVDAGTPEPTPSDNAWYESLDPDLKSNPNITKFDSPEAMAKSHVEMVKMIGKDKVVIPNEKSTPEEWQSFWNAGGRPEDLTGYETPKLEMDDNLLMKDSTVEAFKQKAHELGLNKQQFAELYGFYHSTSQNTYNSMLESSTQARAKSETELRGEWGDAYEAKVDGAQQVINKFFKGKIDDGNKQAFEALANSKGFIQAMSEIAGGMGEDVIAGGARTTLTPSDAQTELNNTIMDMKHPFHDNAHPEHQAAVEKVLALQQMAAAQ